MAQIKWNKSTFTLSIGGKESFHKSDEIETILASLKEQGFAVTILA